MGAADLATYDGALQQAGYPGGLADATVHSIISGINENATAIDVGVPCARGTGGINVRPFAADADDCVGITVRNPSQSAADPATNVVNYPRYSELPIGKIGRFFAIAAEDVRDGDQVLILTAGANVNTTCWASSKGGVAGSGRVAYKGAKWKALPGSTSATITAGTIGIIEVIDQNLGRTTT